jgi:hypothetical protein
MRDNGKTLAIDENAKLGAIPYFIDGAILSVETTQPSKVSHSGLTTADLE